MEEIKILLVAARSNPNKVAGAIVGVIHEQGKVAIQTIGAGALNQAVKAIAIARRFMAQTQADIDLICWPAFANVGNKGEQMTAIKLIVEPEGKKRSELGSSPIAG